MDIANLDYLVSIETTNSAYKSSHSRLQGGSSISRYSFFKGSRSSGYKPVTEMPVTIDELRDLFCQGSSTDGDDTCSIEDFLVSTGSSGEDGHPQFRSVLGVGTLNNGVFSFSSASSSRALKG